MIEKTQRTAPAALTAEDQAIFKRLMTDRAARYYHRADRADADEAYCRVDGQNPNQPKGVQLCQSIRKKK